jgi:hypothetical protein
MLDKLNKLTGNRPINDNGDRVTPSDLESHRLSHEVLAPCCLCPLRPEEGPFVEAAIFTPVRGRFLGEYVAACAKNKCGYISMCPLNKPLPSLTLILALIERIYDRRGVPIRYYPKRGQPLVI